MTDVEKWQANQKTMRQAAPTQATIAALERKLKDKKIELPPDDRVAQPPDSTRNAQERHRWAEFSRRVIFALGSPSGTRRPAAGVRTRQRVAALKRRRPRVRRRSSRAWPPPIVHAWSPGGFPAASPAVARRFRIKSIVRHRAWRPGHRRRPRGAHRRPDRTTLRASSRARKRWTRNR